MEKCYRFNDETRSRLLALVSIEEEQQGYFIGRLESEAESTASLLFGHGCQPQSLRLGAELRKQQIKSLENHLHKALNLLMEIDDNLFAEISRHYSVASGQHWNPFYYRHFKEPETKLTDPVIALAHLSKAAGELKRNFPKDRYSLLEMTARSIKFLFIELGIPFTVSNMGPAAECLRAVLHLAGDTNADHVDHLLTKARDIPSFFDGCYLFQGTEKNL